MRLHRLLAAALAVAALAAPAPASASYPGANGMFAVTEDACQGAIEITYLQAYSVKGKALHELTPSCEIPDGEDEDGEPRGTWGPDWSPDGTRVLYGQDAGGGEPDRYETVKADGTDPQPASAALTGDLRAVGSGSFAPDGRRFAFFAEELKQLFVAPGGEAAPAPLRTIADVLQVEWSPRGGKLAVLRYGSASKAGIWLVDAQTGKLGRRVARGKDLIAFDWSPDGRRIVFGTGYDHSEDDGAVTGANLYTVRADRKAKPRLFLRTKRVAAVNPVWSPDGRSIAWVRVRYTGGDVGFDVIPSLWRKRVKGGKPRKLADLARPNVEEGYHSVPDIAWQPLPRR